MIPKAFGMEKNTNLPHKPCDDRKHNKRNGKKTTYVNHRGEHHQMIPIKDTAGGTAAGSHHEPEWTPNQYTDQITDIEKNRNHKQTDFSDPSLIVHETDCDDQGTPKQKNVIGGLGGGYHIFFQGFVIDLIPDGAEAVAKQFLGTESDLAFDRNDLLDHINDPEKP